MVGSSIRTTHQSRQARPSSHSLLWVPCEDAGAEQLSDERIENNEQASGRSDRMPAYTGRVPERESYIIFFDGECAMCNRFVNFCLKRDAGRILRYAPIDGITWQRCFRNEGDGDRNTVHLLALDEHFVRSSAVIRILRMLGGPWRILSRVLWLVPGPIRNFGYRTIASNRRRFSGTTGACTLPGPGERSCMLP